MNQHPRHPIGPLKNPPRQNERGIPHQPGSVPGGHGGGETKGPRTPPDEAEKPQEPIAPDERGE